MQNGTNGLCEFCQYANGDEFAAGFNIYYSKKWEDYGVFGRIALLISWLCFSALGYSLGAGRRSRLSSIRVLEKRERRRLAVIRLDVVTLMEKRKWFRFRIYLNGLSA